MKSGFASPAFTDLAAGNRETNCGLRPDVTSPVYWAGACVRGSVWLLLILCTVARSLG